MTDSRQVVARQEPSELLEGLTTAYEHAKTARISVGDVGLLEALNSPLREISTPAVLQLHALADRVTELLVKDSRFPGSSARLIRGDGGAGGFYPNMVGLPLITRALQTGSPEAAIEWLRKVLATSSATGKTIHTLWGVPVQQEIDLTPTVKIVPIDKLPDSKQKLWLTEYFHSRLGSPLMTAFDFEPPKSALVVTREIKPFIFDPEAHPNLTNDEFSQTHDLLLEVTLVLTVVGPRVSLPAAQWFTFDDPDLNEASFLSGARRGQMLEILPAWHKTYPLLNAEEAALVVGGYLQLHGNTRSKVRVALQRLNQAQRRHSIGDQAIELSTAFETLLGDNARTEMTHKVKVRSVRLIGGADETRKRNAAILSRTYDIRSALVHTGHVDANANEPVCGQRMSVSDIVDEAVGLCTDLIKIIIRRGSIPDWSTFDIAG